MRALSHSVKQRVAGNFNMPFRKGSVLVTTVPFTKTD